MRTQNNEQGHGEKHWMLESCMGIQLLRMTCMLRMPWRQAWLCRHANFHAHVLQKQIDFLGVRGWGKPNGRYGKFIWPLVIYWQLVRRVVQEEWIHLSAGLGDEHSLELMLSLLSKLVVEELAMSGLHNIHL